MKKFNKSFLYKISSLCIALGGLIYAQGNVHDDFLESLTSKK